MVVRDKQENLLIGTEDVVVDNTYRNSIQEHIQQ